MHTVLKSATKTVTIGHDQPFCIIGERINPTGRKQFQMQLRANDLSRLAIDVEQQVSGGADVLDVNMGVPLTDEPALLGRAITMIQSLTDLPICIDSSIIEALQVGHEVSSPLLLELTREMIRNTLVLSFLLREDLVLLQDETDGTI